jgi:predicted RNA-binding protein YlxR (DUF448 family)
LRIAIADRETLGAAARKRAVPDRDATMPGRGAYLCRSADPNAAAVADRACLERAMRRGGISRALRSSVTLDRKLVESPEAGEAGQRPAGRNGDSRRRRVSPGFGQAPLSLIEP